MPGKLYLIPNSLGSQNTDTFLPSDLKTLITDLKHLVVEDARNARRYLKNISKEVVIDDIHFFELNKHTDAAMVKSFLQPLLDGHDMGIISEAGLPGIADPGAVLVSLAHKRQITVVPLTGPSSLFLALMASGFNGQSFRFSGYLPIQRKERIDALKQLEKRATEQDETQLFIETPYRNNAMLDDICTACDGRTGLCIAADLTMESEMISTAAIREWRKKKPDLHKRPAVFIIGKTQLG
jgi:16S rRNA (cytidine1402-2'-O)-methyltransferase